MLAQASSVTGAAVGCKRLLGIEIGGFEVLVRNSNAFLTPETESKRNLKSFFRKKFDSFITFKNFRKPL